MSDPPGKRSFRRYILYARGVWYILVALAQICWVVTQIREKW